MKAFLDCEFDETRQEPVVVLSNGGGIRQQTCFYLHGDLVCVVVVGYPVGSAAYRAYMSYLAGAVGAGCAA